MKQQTQTNQIEWKEVELSKLCDISGGGTPSRTKPEYWGGEIPWLKISNLKDFYVTKYTEAITEKGLNNSSAKLFKRGTILISIFASLGDVAILDIDATTNQAIAGIYNLKENIDKRYLALYLKSLKRYFEGIGRGVAQNNINLSILRNTKIRIPFSNNSPDLKEQERIVKILEDSELLNKKSKNVDELFNEYLKSVFYEMFLKDKNKFENKKGKELFELTYGKGLSEKERDGKGFPVYGSNGVVGKHSKFLVKGPGIIIGRKGSIGEINYSKENFWAIDTTYYLKPLKNMDFMYLYYLLKFYNLKLNSSTAIPGLNRNDVYRINFVDVPLPLQQKFASMVEQVEKMKEKINKTKQNSEELFNSLMQKAFKGEL